MLFSAFSLCLTISVVWWTRCYPLFRRAVWCSCNRCYAFRTFTGTIYYNI